MRSLRFENINYDFRPESYLRPTNPLQPILAKVTGTFRRQVIRAWCESGGIEDIPDAFLLDSLREEDRDRLGKVHPSLMGGEYLPPCWFGDFEIARIELQSTMRDVISVRARHKCIGVMFLIVDEYDTSFPMPRGVNRTLTLGELIGLIDGAGNGESLALCHTIANYTCGERSIGRLDSLKNFTRVESLFYPQLSLHYEKLTDHWYWKERDALP
jgi:hypothetical protein